MIQSLKLLLPALIPSWRFFDTIAPSPRIEFTTNIKNDDWQEFPIREKKLSLINMLQSLFWNPHRNEALFMASCAERVMQNPTDHSHNEIVKRIEASINDHNNLITIQFRLVFWSRDSENQVQKNMFYLSPLYPINEGVNNGL